MVNLMETRNNPSGFGQLYSANLYCNHISPFALIFLIAQIFTFLEHCCTPLYISWYFSKSLSLFSPNFSIEKFSISLLVILPEAFMQSQNCQKWLVLNYVSHFNRARTTDRFPWVKKYEKSTYSFFRPHEIYYFT